MRRILLAVASATLAVSALAACGGGDSSSDDYCDAVKSFGKTLSNAEGESDYDKMLESVKKVRDAASGDTKDDWDTMIDAFEAMKSGKVDDLDQDATTKAGEAIEKQVKDECDVDLSELD